MGDRRVVCVLDLPPGEAQLERVSAMGAVQAFYQKLPSHLRPEPRPRGRQPVGLLRISRAGIIIKSPIGGR